MPYGRNQTAFPQTNSQQMHLMMDCMSICAACAKKCIEEGNRKTASLCIECADVCALAIKAASAYSEFKHEIMELCAHVCQRCAEECRKVHVAHCQECADICKQCSASCSAQHV